MWTVVKQGHVILITAHIDDFIIACDDRQVLDEFRTALLQRFEGTYEGSERNAVSHLPVHSLLMEVSCNPKVALGKNQEKKEKVESRKTSVRKNTPFSALRSKIALKPPRLRPLKC
jgi:hypothetical protein